MATITSHALIHLPDSDCWQKLRDLTLASNYVPGVTHVEIITDQHEGVGASRIVTLDEAPHQMEETVTEWREGEGFTLKIHKDGKSAIPIFSSFFFHYRIKPDDQDKNVTHFTPSMAFTPKFGVIGRLLFEKAVAKRLQHTLHVIAASMAEYYESGEPVSDARIEALKQKDFTSDATA